MKTCVFDGVVSVTPRSHPWTDAESNPDYRYYDFKSSPAAIRTSLEDFLPFARYDAIEELYSLIEWLNGADSALESNDCAFSAPQENESVEVAAALSCSGRLMVLYRDLLLNVAPAEVERLDHALHRALQSIEPELEWGIIGTTLVPVRYLALSSGKQLGQELMISFWAWGNTEDQLMENLARVVKSLFLALRGVATASL